MPDNRPKNIATPPDKCPIFMSDHLPCGQPVLDHKPEEDEFPVCLMHSHDPNKDPEVFENTFLSILSGTSKTYRAKEYSDFTGFVFNTAVNISMDFERASVFIEAVFLGNAEFHGAIFHDKAYFNRAKFKHEANFVSSQFKKEVSFANAEFSRRASFYGGEFLEDLDCRGATFNGYASFGRAQFSGIASFIFAKFNGDVDFFRTHFKKGFYFSRTEVFKKLYCFETTFSDTTDFGYASINSEGVFDHTWFIGPTNFRGCRFQSPSKIRFRRINRDRKGEEPSIENGHWVEKPYPYPKNNGWKVYFTDCNIEEVVFEDVNWHKPGKRIVLQDELDIYAGKEHNHELVAIAYRRLTNNFDRVRNYDHAEDCFIGTLEMKRLDPNQPRGVRFVTVLYKFASEYGSNYIRALVVLFGLLGVFGILYSLPSFGLSPTSDMAFLEGPYLEGGYSWQQFIDGLLYAFEVITFTREPTFTVTNYPGKAVRILETIFVPAQLALFFLALRRRFRR